MVHVQVLDASVERAPGAPPRAPPGASPGASPQGVGAGRGRILPALLVVTFMAVFVVLAWGRIGAPFGDSHDGRNAAVWASGSRALRTDGPVASRLGARLNVAAGAGSTYIDHPPLTYWETAIAEELAGTHPWSSRAPAWVGTLVAMVLLYLLLQECGVSPMAAAAGVALGFGCPMIGLYGAMLDSWVVGLPWAVASLLVWQRERMRRPCRSWIVALVTVGAVLSSWQGVLLVAAITTVDLVGAMRSRRLPATVRARTLAAAASLVAVGVWMLWAAGSFDGVWSSFVSRTGAGNTAMGPGVAWRSLRSAWSDLLAPWQVALGAPLAIVAVATRRTRRVTVAALATLVVWIGLFRSGAAIHDYWSLWVVLPLSLGFAAGVDALVRFCCRLGVAGAVAPIVAAMAGVGCLGLAQVSVAQIHVSDGEAAATVLGTATYADSQRTAWYVGDLAQPVDWISYLTHRPAEQLLTADAVEQLSGRSPDDVILAGGDKSIGTHDTLIVCPIRVPGSRYTLWTARQLADLLQQQGC
ncbi:MAG: ArnT family glycosyltransferase [Acidimicrobiales bacterium]